MIPSYGKGVPSWLSATAVAYCRSFNPGMWEDEPPDIAFPIILGRKVGMVPTLNYFWTQPPPEP